MNIPIINFNGGELSSLIDVRSDIEKYKSGCRTLENMIPLIYGPSTRRPGTKYIYKTKLGTGTRLIPFIYSSEIAYMCEFGHEYIRFYYDGSILLDGAVPVEVASDYDKDDLPALTVKQQGDTMWILHPDYKPKKLTRTSATEFSLDDIVFTNGPFLVRNDLAEEDGVTMKSSVTAVNAVGTLTAGVAAFTFQPGHVGALFKLVHPRETTKVSISTAAIDTSDAIDVKGAFDFVTEGTWVGTVVLERNIGNTDWEPYRTYDRNENNVSLAETETEDNVRYRIRVSEYTSGTVKANISVQEATKEGIVRITAINSATEAAIKVVKELESTDSTAKWHEGAWSGVRGYPRAFTFFEGRTVYGGTDNDPQTLWLSKTDDYENFDEGVNDADSFSIVLTTTNIIQWIDALQAIVVGTSGDEWAVNSTKFYEPLTPTNYAARMQTTNGSAAIQALRAREVILFVDYVGRKIRELTYNSQEDRYTAPDLTSLAEHITLGGITHIAYQKSPDSILWAVRSDGMLLSMSYERDQNVVAWSKHPLQTGATVESVAVIPGDDEDEVWLTVNRTINGSDVVYVERFGSRTFSTQSDAYFVDCGITYSGAAKSTFSGLDHLEGETVKILGDGAVYDDETVVGGEVTIDTEVVKASIGLSNTYKLKPMILDINAQEGSIRGTIRRVPELVLSFVNTFNTKYGVDTDNLFDINWRTTEVYGDPPAMFTGDKIVNFDGGFSNDESILISGSGPEPCTIRAIIPRTDITGR